MELQKPLTGEQRLEIRVRVFRSNQLSNFLMIVPRRRTNARTFGPELR